MKSYKKMNDFELKQEIMRIQTILATSKNLHTTKQNKKYLEKLYTERRNRLRSARD